VAAMNPLSKWFAIAAILLCTLGQAAHAQAPSPGSVADAASRLNQEIALLAGKQYIPVGPKVSGPVPVGQRHSITVQLASGVSNAIVASCGGDCDQVEIALFDYQHVLVARSSADRNVAVRIGKPKYSGLYQVEIGVPGCHASPCSVALAVLRQKGPAPDTATDVRSRLDRSAQFLKDQDYLATADPVFDKIPAGRSKSFPVTLTSAAINSVVATCGPDCDHVQISLFNYQHALIAQSTEKEAIVYKFGKPPYEGLYQVVIGVPGCRAAECDVAFLVLRQATAEAAPSPQPPPDGSSPQASTYTVDGLALGSQVRFDRPPHQRYSCGPSEKFAGFTWCHDEQITKEKGNEITRSRSILHTPSGTAWYVNSYIEPAFFAQNDVQNEISRLSGRFGQEASVMRMEEHAGWNAVIAVWGATILQPLSPAEVATVASGGTVPGFLVSYLGDLQASAKAGAPVFRLAGGAGFVWAAGFKSSGRGVLRFLAVDMSKIVAATQFATPGR
jgi:hypothetical protein